MTDKNEKNTLQWTAKNPDKDLHLKNTIQPETRFSLKALLNHQKKTPSLYILAAVITLVQFALFSLLSGTTSSFQNSPQVAVAFSKTSIAKGTALHEGNVEVAYVAYDETTAQTFLKNSEIEKFIGKRFAVSLPAGTPLVKNFFLSEFQQNSMPDKIPPGKRLFILHVENSEANSLVKKGDRVDVVAHLNLPDVGQALETILEAAEVVGFGASESKEDNSNAVSFYLSPDDVKVLIFMKKFASFSLVLRNPNDRAKENNGAITLNKFLDDKRIQKIMQDDTFRIIPMAKDTKSPSSQDSE